MVPGFPQISKTRSTSTNKTRGQTDNLKDKLAKRQSYVKSRMYMDIGDQEGNTEPQNGHDLDIFKFVNQEKEPQY